MKQIWTEARIRAELVKLDAKTNLNGSSLPIVFNNAKSTLGTFDSRGKGKFIFSKYYYQNPDWPEELTIETIRHEYAHYMDYEIYGKLGHGPTWKACCSKVGIAASRLYNPKSEEYYRNKKKAEQIKLESISHYSLGDKIMHPRYGGGVIKKFEGEQSKKLAVVEFEEVGVKTLSLLWVRDHCGGVKEK